MVKNKTQTKKSGIRRLFKKPEIVIALLSFLFGLTFIIAIKPLQIPDEPNHFIRSYQISEGGVFQQINSNGDCSDGGGSSVKDKRVVYSVIPKSIVTYADGNRDDYRLNELLKTPLNSPDRVNACARQTAANSPVGYLPQAAAIGVMRVFDAPPVLMNYAARLAILFTWVVCVYFAIRIIPVRKWALGGVALLPMAIQQSMAIGADVLSIAPIMVFVAILIRSYYENRSSYIKKDLSILAGLVAVAALAKPVTIVLLLLVPFYNTSVPNGKDVMKARLLKVAAVLMPLILWLSWSALASSHHLSVTDVFPKASEQVSSITSSPIEGGSIFIESMARYILYDLSLWGYGSFQWFTASMPEALIYIGVANLFILLIVGYSEAKKLLSNVKSKKVMMLNSVIALTALGILVGNIFTLYVIYTPPGSWKVEGMQFRYHLPVFILLAVMIERKFAITTERSYRNFILANACAFFLISLAVILDILPTR